MQKKAVVDCHTYTLCDTCSPVGPTRVSPVSIFQPSTSVVNSVPTPNQSAEQTATHGTRVSSRTEPRAAEQQSNLIGGSTKQIRVTRATDEQQGHMIDDSKAGHSRLKRRQRRSMKKQAAAIDRKQATGKWTYNVDEHRHSNKGELQGLIKQRDSTQHQIQQLMAQRLQLDSKILQHMDSVSSS